MSVDSFNVKQLFPEWVTASLTSLTCEKETEDSQVSRSLNYLFNFINAALFADLLYNAEEFPLNSPFLQEKPLLIEEEYGYKLLRILSKQRTLSDQLKQTLLLYRCIINPTLTEELLQLSHEWKSISAHPSNSERGDTDNPRISINALQLTKEKLVSCLNNLMKSLQIVHRTSSGFQDLTSHKPIDFQSQSSEIAQGQVGLHSFETGQTLRLHPFFRLLTCDICKTAHLAFLEKVDVQNRTFHYIEPFHQAQYQLTEWETLAQLAKQAMEKRLIALAKRLYFICLEKGNPTQEVKKEIVRCLELAGNYYFQSRRYFLAINEFERALQINARHSRILYNVSLTYKKLNENGKAKTYLEKLLKVNPSHAKGFELIAIIHEEEGDLSKALFYLNQFLKIHPQNDLIQERRSKIVKKLEKSVNIPQEEKTKKPNKEEKGISFDDLVEDLTQLALQEKITPIIGRESEIERVVEILSCLKKRNALIIGEPGVGKTSLVEELARKIVFGHVPEPLKNTRILRLNNARLMAGTKFRGQFEERMLMLIQELKKKKRAILFIDDLHTIMGAGTTRSSSLDSAAILKPELSKGEIQVIGICTYDEYRLFLEKDQGFERRFQVVRIEEPDREHSIMILDTIRPLLEAHHNVLINAEALEAAIDLPKKYLRDRYLPDKAIDLLDRSCATAVVNATFSKELIQSDQTIVTKEDVLKTVSHLTNIPIIRLLEDQSQRFATIEKSIKKRIVGQDEAVETVSRVLRTVKMGFEINPMAPDGVFLFVGPTGVGKTELAKTLAEFLFGDEEKMLRIDMSEFTDDISTSKLIGITPGYVGYHDRNQLTDHVRNNPHSLILLDEVEKANKQVLNLFLQVFDSGRLTDGRGRTIFFNNTTFVMTSNIGADLFSRNKVGYRLEHPGAKNEFHSSVSKGELLDAVKNFLPPEFLNRIDEIVFFKTLDRDDIKKIANQQLQILRQKLQFEGKELILGESALDLIVSKGYSEQYGARNLNRAIRKLLLDPLALKALNPEWEEKITIEVNAGEEELLFD